MMRLNFVHNGTGRARLSDVLTLREVASYLRVHPNTIYRLARSGKLPAFKMGTDWRFHRAAVDTYLKEQQAPTRDAADEVLDLAHWMVGEGLCLTLSQTDIARLLDWRPGEVRDAVRRLVVSGHATLVREQLALTPDGLREARNRSARAIAPPSGHESVRRFQESHRAP